MTVELCSVLQEAATLHAGGALQTTQLSEHTVHQIHHA